MLLESCRYASRSIFGSREARQSNGQCVDAAIQLGERLDADVSVIPEGQFN
jgi:hypothetical protein